MALRILINGAKGRMGHAIARCAEEEKDIEIVASLDAEDDLAAVIGLCDVVVDFSHHSVTAAVAGLSAQQNKALVIGTTGQDDAARTVVQTASETIPIVFAPNFSVGVNALFFLVEAATQILGPDFDLEVVEMHHRLKKDSPSGTARRLAEILAEVRKLSYDKDVRHGREGIVGERTNQEIGMHAIRGGDVVGDHTVIFATQGERLEITHRASSRNTFAKGALRAARWVVGKPPHVYDMVDVLGLREET
jgi:4-hydroxy-tetrahydrodipicolinate reductase